MDDDTHLEVVTALPLTHRVTDPLISDLSFSRKSQKRREKRLTIDTPEVIATRAAYTSFSKNSIESATTLEEIDTAQKTRRGARKPCREFEGGIWRQRDLRVQETTTKWTYATIATR
jgi:hypothetical protein